MNNFSDMPIFVMPNMLTMAPFVLTLEPLTIPAQIQDGSLPNINKKRQASIHTSR